MPSVNGGPSVSNSTNFTPVTYDPLSGTWQAGGQVITPSVSGGPIVAAPATLDGSNVGTYNGGTVSLAAGATLTVSDAAWAGLTGGLTILVGQSGTATLAFSGTATKENAAGSSAVNVNLVAAGVYVIQQSPTGTPKFRVSGGSPL